MPNLSQHTDFVDMIVRTGAAICLEPPVKTEKMFCYLDPRDHKFHILSGFQELEDLIFTELTAELTRSGSQFTLFFERSDWFYLEHDKMALLSNLSAIQGISIHTFVIEYEHSDMYLIKYQTKEVDDSID